MNKKDIVNAKSKKEHILSMETEAHDKKKDSLYRSGTVNSNTVNSKFHLIRSFFEIFARYLLFHV